MKFRFSLIAQIAVPIEDPATWPADAEIPGHQLRSKGLQTKWIEIRDTAEADRFWDTLKDEALFIQKRLEGRLDPEIIVPMQDEKS